MNQGSSGTSPAQRAAKLSSREEQQKAVAAERQRLAIALANVLGTDDAHRSTDQKTAFDYLTGPMWEVCRSLDTNELLIFEGQRRTAAQLLVLVREAGR